MSLFIWQNADGEWFSIVGGGSSGDFLEMKLRLAFEDDRIRSWWRFPSGGGRAIAGQVRD